MSYHAQQSSQQKSIGILIVVAFHILLVFALVAGLRVGRTIDIPDSITVNNIKEKPVDITPIAPPPPSTRDPIITIPAIPPTVIDNDPPPPTEGKANTGGIGTEVLATMSKPKLQNPSTPTYPTASVRMNEEGTTGLSLYVTADGRVSEASVYSSSGYSRLDDAAVKHALRYWRFTPCVENGTAIGCWFQTKLTWKLEDAAKR